MPLCCPPSRVSSEECARVTLSTHMCETDGHQRVGSHWPSVGALSGHR